MITQVRAADITELPPPTELGPYVTWSLTHNEPVRVGDLLLVPDLVVAEWVANDTDLPETVTIQRDDGRAASIFAVVGQHGYPLHPTSE